MLSVRGSYCRRRGTRGSQPKAREIEREGGREEEREVKRMNEDEDEDEDASMPASRVRSPLHGKGGIERCMTRWTGQCTSSEKQVHSKDTNITFLRDPELHSALIDTTTTTAQRRQRCEKQRERRERTSRIADKQGSGTHVTTIRGLEAGCRHGVSGEVSSHTFEWD